MQISKLFHFDNDIDQISISTNAAGSISCLLWRLYLFLLVTCLYPQTKCIWSYSSLPFVQISRPSLVLSLPIVVVPLYNLSHWTLTRVQSSFPPGCSPFQWSGPRQVGQFNGPNPSDGTRLAGKVFRVILAKIRLGRPGYSGWRAKRRSQGLISSARSTLLRIWP